MKTNRYLTAILAVLILLISLACNLIELLEGPSENQLEYEKDLKSQKITQTYLHTTPDYIWITPTHTKDVAKTQTVSAEPRTCEWVYQDETDHPYINSSLPENSTAERIGKSIIHLTYPHPGYSGCTEQILQTAHYWDELPTVIKPGEKLEMNLMIQWALIGTPQCTSLLTSFKTEFVSGTTRISASKSNVLIAREPSGTFEMQGEWIMPGSTVEGKIYPVSIRAEQPGMSYLIYFNYKYVCRSK